MRSLMRARLPAVLSLLLVSGALAQETKSPALAKQLAAALDAAKLDSVAAKDPDQPDRYVAALYFPGSQLLVVSARYAAPVLLNDKLAKKDYREIYIDLHSASIAATKVFIEDPGADGLKAKRTEGQPFDTYEGGGKRTAFDGDWKGQKLSEEEYLKAFSAADEQYSRMLTALISALRKIS
jgi:hypothetical protein